MNKMDDPKVKNAIRVLFTRNITLEQIREVYEYFRKVQEVKSNG